MTVEQTHGNLHSTTPSRSLDNYHIDVATDDRLVAFFDIDNTLYSASSRISEAMGTRIHAYFLTLGISDKEASELHHEYYTLYGLALRGLTRHHDVDPLDFDLKCDGSLPLEEMIQPDPPLRKLFQDINRSKVRVWALTNAYRTHAQRVLKILDLEDQIDGLIYCDYAEPNFTCKPEAEYYRRALKKANVKDPAKCLFIDDSLTNVKGAIREGWGRCVHFRETGLNAMEGGKMKEIGSDKDLVTDDSNGQGTIVAVSDLQQLREVWPDIFEK
ncbi:hypothetical protein EW146_g9427 [Bondarzewia mesenterica]|uniref:Pyrimidine 5'-nucleotidase n=1 Tax=Bondarzewia mesenterica TaxID=1095465 RepID=A0A4S4L6M3_9AGAM|nr:hypothetical protein EW146_g9427 [Bondarzewia mesenterica]